MDHLPKNVSIVSQSPFSGCYSGLNVSKARGDSNEPKEPPPVCCCDCPETVHFAPHNLFSKLNDEQRRKIDSALRRALGKEDLPDCSLMPLENDMMRIMASFTGPDFFDPDKTDTFPSCDVPIGTDVSIASIIEKFVCAFKSKVEATEEGKSLM